MARRLLRLAAQYHPILAPASLRLRHLRACSHFVGGEHSLVGYGVLLLGHRVELVEVLLGGVAGLLAAERRLLGQALHYGPHSTFARCTLVNILLYLLRLRHLLVVMHLQALLRLLLGWGACLCFVLIHQEA